MKRCTKRVGSSSGGVLDRLGKTLNEAQDQVSKLDPAANGRSATAAPGKSKRALIEKAAAPAAPDKSKRGAIEEAAAPAAPRPSYQDAMGIRTGMSREEVTRRFGPPAMAFAGEDDGQTMNYAGKTGRVQVECQGGKVASAEKSK